ncbi:hypothetical protein Lesp02_59390 [Lentzea sp. NBRC 105346]|uniref:MarR family winged helix-turn-helix transcriptional regulator n=1 Tax=Lentzea sp. NBRC 105346 TaxID=3032205 RepID=UPI0024A5F746|nr:MarR family transcriptional regulator [Lentzea sp. NBRC 105346]GLZ33751.1 hypothetical protein Lesp02_59390 [Lentzea sp. NBRC 105346]
MLSIDRDLTLLFTALSAACDVRVRQRLADAGHPQVRTIYGYVFQHLVIGPTKVTDLADLLGMTPQGASKVITEMERAGYVSRYTDPNDSRVRVIELTEHGQHAIDEGRKARAEVTAELLGVLGPRAEAFLEQLNALSDHTNALPEMMARRLRPH